MSEIVGVSDMLGETLVDGVCDAVAVVLIVGVGVPLAVGL